VRFNPRYGGIKIQVALATTETIRRFKTNMANTYTQMYLHIIFSTKNRVDWIRPGIEARVWEYIGGIARNHKLRPHQIGGIDNHVHALVGSHPTVSPSDAAKYLKGGSSKWIHDEFSDLDRFAWQDGYGAFSVSKSALPEVKR
jgi:putative transposase